MKAIDVFLRSLKNQGVRYVFGNPGTCEAPLVDAIQAYSDMEYVLALHEIVAVGTADAHAQATGNVAVANLHVAPGLGNGMGMLFNAYIGNSPLIVTAGQQDSRMRLREPLLWHDLVEMAKPVTKWSVQVEHADEMSLIMQRAIKMALDPPQGPVFISMPIDVMESETDKEPPGSYTPPALAPADPDAVVAMAKSLLGARNPIIVHDSSVYREAAQAELISVAEFLGAGVHSMFLLSNLGFPMDHPQYLGELDETLERVRHALNDADVILLIGGDFFREVFYSDAQPWSEGTRTVQIHSSADAIGQTHPVDLGICANIKTTLAALQSTLVRHGDESYGEQAGDRRDKLENAAQTRVRNSRAADRKDWDESPMSAPRFLTELKEHLPDQAIILSESISYELDVQRILAPSGAADYFGSRGGGIGQGFAGAAGTSLAFEDRPVFALSGDGSAMYSVQALWTAARYRLPITFVVLNNRAYKILQTNLGVFREKFGRECSDDYPMTDIEDPVTDFVALAQGWGVPGRTISEPGEVADAVKTAVAGPGPYLLDVLVS